MTDAFPTPTATPKRKRNDGDRSLSPIHTSSEFSFQLPEAQNDEDGNASPRSKVVQKFRGLALNGGGGGVAQQHNTGTARQRQGVYDPTRDVEDSGIYNDDPFTSRKRFKVPEVEMTDVDDAQTILIPDPEVRSRPALAPKPRVTFATATEAADANPPVTTTANNVGVPMTAQSTTWQRPQHLASRLQDGKGKGRRRAGTPPLRGCKKKNTVGGSAATAAQTEGDTEPQIVDPVRAALTWKDDEITVYDPEDQDDDGTGINGIGFMPTAAIAYARTQKRRLQLAEYRKREESEARARRNQRRRGSGAGINMKTDSKATSGGGGGGGVRKVRFMESEPNTIVTNG